jgi:cell division protein FtsL
LSKLNKSTINKTINKKDDTEKKATKASNAKPKKKMRRSTAVYIAVMSFMTVFFVLIMYHQYRTKIAICKSIEAVNEQIAEQESINEALKKEINFKDTPEYVEKIAREKLGMVMPNEIVFVDENK